MLTDLNEKSFQTYYKEDKINHSYFVSSPGYTCDAGLKYTKTGLENLGELDLFLIFETAIRSGLSGRMGERYLVPVNVQK